VVLVFDHIFYLIFIYFLHLFVVHHLLQGGIAPSVLGQKVEIGFIN